MHQGERIGVGYDHGFGVHHRQRELRALQQGAHVAYVGERGNAGAGAAFELLLGGDERGAELVQRIASEHGGEQQAVGLEGAAYLRQHSREVVDELQGQPRDDEIERPVAEGQHLLVARNAQAGALGEQSGGRLRADHGGDAGQAADPSPDQAVMRTEVEHDRERTAHGGQPLDKVVRDAGEQELVPGGVSGGPVAPQPRRPTVEDVRGAGPPSHAKVTLSVSLPVRCSHTACPKLLSCTGLINRHNGPGTGPCSTTERILSDKHPPYGQAPPCAPRSARSPT